MSFKESRVRTCAHCEGVVARTKREHSWAVGGTSFVARVDAGSCKRCRALFLPGRALARIELEIACVIARHAPPTGESLRFLRKALGIHAVSLASLLQVTAETLSRWECGQRRVDANAWITVGSLVLEKAGKLAATRDRLEALGKPVALPAVVRVDVDGRRKGAFVLKVIRSTDGTRTATVTARRRLGA